MKYYYNEQEHSFYVTTNFEPDEAPEGFIEITEEEFNAMQEELQNE